MIKTFILTIKSNYYKFLLILLITSIPKQCQDNVRYSTKTEKTYSILRYRWCMLVYQLTLKVVDQLASNIKIPEKTILYTQMQFHEQLYIYIAAICIQNYFCDVLTVINYVMNVLPEVVPFCKSGHNYFVLNMYAYFVFYITMTGDCQSK